AASAASATPGKSFAEARRSGVFLVEDVERRQADVGDFFLTESDLRPRGIPRRYIRRRHGGCCGCAARPGQRHPHDSPRRESFPHAPSLPNKPQKRHNPKLPLLPTTPATP